MFVYKMLRILDNILDLWKKTKTRNTLFKWWQNIKYSARL